MKDKCGKKIPTVKKVNCEGNIEEVSLGSLGGPCPPKGTKKAPPFMPRKKKT